MDRWLNDAPALVYVRELSMWIVVNNNGNMIAWTDDAAEAKSLSLWVVGYEPKTVSQSRRTMALAS